MAAPPTQGFQPDPQGTNQIIQLFRENLAGGNHSTYERLEQLQKHPQFNSYLAYILSSCKQEPEAVRSAAGLKLKFNIKLAYESMDTSMRHYIKQQVLATMGDSSKFIRKIVGTVLATMAAKDLLFANPPRAEGWGQLLKLLLSSLNDPGSSPHLVDGAFNALSKICEDMPQQLDSQHLGSPLGTMLPTFIGMFLNPNEDIRKYALGAVNGFLCLMPDALVRHMDKYMQGLFQLTADPNKEIRKHVCRAFVMLLEVGYSHLHPHMENVIKFMLVATQDGDEVVSLEACEFWVAYAEAEQADQALLARYLKHLVPILLKGMIYTEADLQTLVVEEEDANVPDRAEDIKPRFHQSKGRGAGGDDDDDWGDDDEVANWNLRKCSAAALDTLATMCYGSQDQAEPSASLFRDDFLAVLLPMLQAKLTDQDWTVRESSILALGAIAEGCFEGIQAFLKDLVPYLIGLLTDEKPFVRSICCWTLSRYAKWVCAQAGDEDFFKPLMVALLTRVLDPNKKVQEAACSAFATLEETAGRRLLPYLEPILQNLMYAFHQYQTKNLLILYDAIGTLAEVVGPGLNDPKYVNTLMTPLLQRWGQLADDDRSIFPLLECLTSIAQALGPGFSPFAPAVFGRCLAIVEANLVVQQRAQQCVAAGLDAVFPDKEFMVCALDLLSALAEGLQGSIESLVGQSTILGLLFGCVQDRDPDVRQSAFALLGDFAKSCIGHVKPHIDKFLPAAAKSLDPRHISVCNNSSWAIGEIAVRLGPDMPPYVDDIMKPLAFIISQKHLNSLLENCTITIGRIGLVCPERVAPFLPQLCPHWFVYLSRIRDPREKEHAYRGLCAVIQKNPQAILPHFADLCQSVATFNVPGPQGQAMHLQFNGLLNSYKQMLGAQWPQFFNSCPEPLRAHLTSLYKL